MNVERLKLPVQLLFIVNISRTTNELIYALNL